MSAPAGDGAGRRRGVMVYPRSRWRRALFRMPLVLWRLGLGPALRGRMAVLTTTGRRSGRPRRTALEYSIHGGRAYVASGWGLDPDWCRNLLADRRATIQCSLGTIAARAVRVEDEAEHLALVQEARARSPVWKEYLEALGIEDDPVDYLAKRDRVVSWRFDPTDEPVPPPLRADLAWCWALAIATLALWAWAG